MSSRDDRGRGVGSEELSTIYRRSYLHAVEMVRADHDPDEDWEGFREALWEALVLAFGLDVEVLDEPPDEPQGRSSP